MDGILGGSRTLLRQGVLILATPKLSVVVVGSRPAGPPATLFEVLRPGLRDQTIEIVVATASQASFEINLPAGVKVHRSSVGTTIPRLRSAGLRVASGELVALTEDFCVPAPGWASAIITAHQRTPSVAVGGPVDRDCGDLAGWALTFFEYGQFFGNSGEGPQLDLPSINVSYKTRRLRDLIGEIPDEFLETSVHGWLRERGETLWREPQAVMFDVSRQPFAESVVSQYHHGRLFGGRFRHHSSSFNKFLRSAAIPIVPAILFRRILGGAFPTVRRLQLIESSPWILLLCAAFAVGEGMGTLLGEKDSLAHWQ
jgi:hypothetical protein